MTAISLIIPIYNVETYLRESIDSVINQTFKNIEIICINDGSTDNSLEILNEYANNDKRIKIINIENRGVGFARNLGLEIANGEFIYFLDSDDYILPNALEAMYNCAKTTKSDIIMMGALAFAEDNSKDTLKNILVKTIVHLIE